MRLSFSCRVLLLTAIGYCLVGEYAYAVSTLPPTAQPAAQFVVETSFRVSEILLTTSPNTEERKQDLTELYRSTMDEMSLCSRTRSWYVCTTMAEADKQAYLAQIKQIVVEIFATRFGDFAGAQVHIERVDENQSKTVATVSGRLEKVGKKPESVLVTWHLAKKKDEYRITNIVVARIVTLTDQISAALGLKENRE